MKYCYACGHMTGGEPHFCNFCGRSYDVKLCPKLHVNPRIAEVCSHCGSRDLSIPQPEVPLLWRFLAFLAHVLSGILLLFLSLPIALQLGRDLLDHFEVQAPLLVVTGLLVASWLLWTLLPARLRRMMHRSLSGPS